MQLKSSINGAHTAFVSSDSCWFCSKTIILCIYVHGSHSWDLFRKKKEKDLADLSPDASLFSLVGGSKERMWLPALIPSAQPHPSVSQPCIFMIHPSAHMLGEECKYRSVRQPSQYFRPCLKTHLFLDTAFDLNGLFSRALGAVLVSEDPFLVLESLGLSQHP